MGVLNWQRFKSPEEMYSRPKGTTKKKAARSQKFEVLNEDDLESVEDISIHLDESYEQRDEEEEKWESP